MKLLFGQGRRELTVAHRLFGIPLGRMGWQYGLLLFEDHKTLFIGWFRDEAFIHMDDKEGNTNAES